MQHPDAIQFHQAAGAAHDPVAAVNALAAAGATADDPVLVEALTEILVEAMAGFATAASSPEASALVGRLDARLASDAFNLLVTANFPDGAASTAELNDAVVLTLIELLIAAGERDRAGAVLAEAAADVSRGPLAWGRWRVRCALRGCDPRPFAHWPVPSGLEKARAAVAERPCDVEGYSRLAAALVAANDIEAASHALATALALPISETEKLPLAEGVARLTVLALARGERAVLDESRFAWPLAALAKVRGRARERLATDAPGFADAGLVAEARAWLAGPPRSPYPMIAGRPRIETVWLEITNVCNQRCSFCPDMFREDARAWLPLDRIKALIDQMAATLSIGSMQLNAYGEPLLHPQIAEILAYIREKRLPWPTFFTSHGMTLVDKKLAQLSNNYPAGVAISLHNDGEESYAATRRAKIGDYATLVARVTALMRQMVAERADCHLRLYQMVHNANADVEVDPETRAAFPDSAARLGRHVRKWEAIAAQIAAEAPPESRAIACVSDEPTIAAAFARAEHSDTVFMPILEWTSADGRREHAFISARPVGTYANLLLEYDDRWTVGRGAVNHATCAFTRTPSLAIFATGRLGICCLDLNSTATFGALDDYPSLVDAVASPEALTMFGQLANGIATSRGCQICLSDDKRFCAETPRLSGPDLRLQ